MWDNFECFSEEGGGKGLRFERVGGGKGSLRKKVRKFNDRTFSR